MIEVVLCGDYWGPPHEVGAWAYLARSGQDVLREGKGSDRPDAIASRLATEVAALASALEHLALECHGEDILVRTATSGLQGLLLHRGPGVARDVMRWYERLRLAATRCNSVRILPAEGVELRGLRVTIQNLLPPIKRRLPVARAIPPGRPGDRIP